jgi:hypothetical protein
MQHIVLARSHFAGVDRHRSTGIDDDEYARRHAAHVGCIAGSPPEKEYLALIEAAGFGDVRNAKAQPIRLPDEILSPHFSAEEIAAFRASGVELKSVTVLATKPTMMKPMMAHERP